MKTIPLSQGRYALVSDEDYERVAAHKWSLSYSPKNRLMALTRAVAQPESF